MTTPATSHDHALAVRFPFDVDLAFCVAALPFGVTPRRAHVDVEDDTFRAVFGPWVVETPLDNVVSASVTGPYRLLKVVGPPHLSIADQGLTFATNARQGVCVRFRTPVKGIDPLGLVRHPALTVTVDRPAELAELLDRARHAARSPTEDGDVTVDDLVEEVHDDLEALTATELRARARARGLDGTSSMRKRELIDALSVPATDLATNE